jgi:hypothetical protein
MGEHKNKTGSPVHNGLHGSEPRTRQTWSTMNNATKHLFMAVLVVMAGALLSMVPGGKDPGVRCQRHRFCVVCRPPPHTRMADLAFFEACAWSAVGDPIQS